MRILDYKIDRTGVVNVVKQAQQEHEMKVAEDDRRAKKMREKIMRTALIRSRAKVQTWLNARITAESIIMPNNTELIRVFKDIEVDLHLWALMQTIRLKVIANGFFIKNKDGEVDEVATEMFHRKWFRKSRRFIVDSEFYGFSLIQFLDIVDGCFSDAELVPREYVIQQKKGVKKTLANAVDLMPFDAPEFLNWLVAVGETDNLGLLDKAAPLVIKKKEVISAWTEASELFAMPIRIGKTNINDPVRKNNMNEMLDGMGAAAWATIGDDDSIDFVETSKTDFFKIYQEFINTVNSEMSKGFLLQTGTTDEKAYSGSAGVHENVLKDLIESYIVLVEEVTNESIIPAMVRLNLIPEGHYFESDNEQKLPLIEMVKLVAELLKSYDIEPDIIENIFSIEVTKKEVPDQLQGGLEGVAKIAAGTNNSKEGIATTMKAVKNLYSAALKSCNEEAV